MNKLTLRDDTIDTMLLCLYVAEPCTFLTSNTVLGTLFSSENRLYIQNGKNETGYLLHRAHLFCSTAEASVRRSILQHKTTSVK